jgi:hypothetical protein
LKIEEVKSGGDTQNRLLKQPLVHLILFYVVAYDGDDDDNNDYDILVFVQF